MKKYNFLFLFAILFLTSALQAQDYWSRRYDMNRGNDTGLNIMTTDSFIYIETFGLCEHNTIGCYGIMKLDYQGNLVKQMLIDTIFRTNSAVGASVLVDDKIFINVNYRTPLHQDSNHVEAVLAYDLDLNYQGLVPYGSYYGYVSAARNIDATNKGFYLTSDEKYTNNKYYAPIRYFDKDWNLKWEIELDENLPYSYSATVTMRGLEDGSLYLGYAGCNGFQCAGIFERLDSLGNLVWRNEGRYLLSANSIAPIEIYEPDNGLVGLWQMDTLVVHVYTNIPPVLYRFAADGTLLWEKAILSGWGQYLDAYDLFTSPSGNIIVTGSWNDYDYWSDPYQNNEVHTGAYIGCFSASGETLWQRRLFDATQGDKTGWFLRGKSMENGDLLFTGEIRDTLPDDPYPWNVWIVKTDSMGCLEPGCQDTTLYVVDSEEPFLIKKPASFLLFPNPTQGEMRLGISTATHLPKGNYQYKIYDPLGRSLIAPRRIENPNILQSIDVGFLPSGLYYMIIELDGVGFEQILFMRE